MAEPTVRQLPSKPLTLAPECADLLADACSEIDQLARMKPQQAANDSPYWPCCINDPAFLSWLHRFMAIVKNTRTDTPTHVLVRMMTKHGPIPIDWRLAVLFLMEQAQIK